MSALVIVDDDVALAQVLARRFTQHGYKVTVFSEPVTNETLVASAADAFLLDMRFAEQSGLSFIEPLRKALPGCRIVLLTGYASIASAVQAIKLGADDFLTKPVDFPGLLLSIQSEPVINAKTDETSDIHLSPEQIEWEHIQRVLQQQDGNISQTARLLGMHRRTLQRKLQKRRPC